MQIKHTGSQNSGKSGGGNEPQSELTLILTNHDYFVDGSILCGDTLEMHEIK